MRNEDQQSQQKLFERDVDESYTAPRTPERVLYRKVLGKVGRSGEKAYTTQTHSRSFKKHKVKREDVRSFDAVIDLEPFSPQKSASKPLSKNQESILETKKTQRQEF